MALQQEFKRTNNTLEIVHCWYEPYHKTGCVFFVIWDLFCMAFCSHVFVALFRGKLEFPTSIFVLILFLLLILAPTYWMLLFLINKTRVKLSRTHAVVCSGPLPSFRKNYSFSLKDINHIWIEEHSVNKTFEETWQLKADETCNVKTVLKNGSSIDIFKNLQNHKEAQIVREKIYSWLNEVKKIDLDKAQMRRNSVQTYKKKGVLAD